MNAFAVWAIIIPFYGAIIYGLVWHFRTLSRMRRDIGDIKEMLRQIRGTPKTQE